MVSNGYSLVNRSVIFTLFTKQPGEQRTAALSWLSAAWETADQLKVCWWRLMTFPNWASWRFSVFWDSQFTAQTLNRSWLFGIMWRATFTAAFEMSSVILVVHEPCRLNLTPTASRQTANEFCSCIFTTNGYQNVPEIQTHFQAQTGFFHVLPDFLVSIQTWNIPDIPSISWLFTRQPLETHQPVEPSFFFLLAHIFVAQRATNFFLIKRSVFSSDGGLQQRFAAAVADDFPRREPRGVLVLSHGLRCRANAQQERGGHPAADGHGMPGWCRLPWLCQCQKKGGYTVYISIHMSNNVVKLCKFCHVVVEDSGNAGYPTNFKAAKSSTLVEGARMLLVPMGKYKKRSLPK